jgi:hypothetical protein
VYGDRSPDADRALGEKTRSLASVCGRQRCDATHLPGSGAFGALLLWRRDRRLRFPPSSKPDAHDRLGESRLHTPPRLPPPRSITSGERSARRCSRGSVAVRIPAFAQSRTIGAEATRSRVTISQFASLVRALERPRAHYGICASAVRVATRRLSQARSEDAGSIGPWASRLGRPSRSKGLEST